MKRFVCSYNHGDGEWSTCIDAESMEDAAERVSSMRATLRLDGESIATFPVWMPCRIVFWWVSVKEWLLR